MSSVNEDICYTPFKKYDAILNNKSENFENKVQSLIDVWKGISELNLTQFSIRYVIQIIDWAKLHALDIVLTGEWKKITETSKNSLLENIEKAQNNLATVNDAFSSRCQKLADVVRKPWQDPVLTKLIQEENVEIGTKEIEFFCVETAYLVSVRLKKLCENHCEDLALNLVSNFLNYKKLATTNNYNLNATETQLWFIFDINIALLFKFQKKERMLQQLEELLFTDAVGLVKRFAKKRVQISKIWRHCNKITLFCCKLFLTRMLMKYADDLKDLLVDLLKTYLNISISDVMLKDFVDSVRHITNVADAAGLCVTCEVIHREAADRLRHFAIEMYIRALTTDMNELERLKHANEEDKVKLTTSRLSNTFTNLSDLLDDHVKIARECVLTAFSLEPTKERLKQIVDLALRSGFPVLDTGQEWKCRLHPPALPSDDIAWMCSECGEWMCKPELQAPLQMNLPLQEALQESVLGISEALCDDLVVCLSNPRYQILSWLLSWSDLYRLCIMYLNDPEKTKNFVTELKFVDVDYSMFEHIKREPVDEYTGIEKGYEQYLDLDFVSDEETSSVSEDSVSHDKYLLGMGSDGTGEPYLPLLLQTRSDPNTLKSLRMFRPNLKRKKEEAEPSSSEKKPNNNTTLSDSSSLTVNISSSTPQNPQPSASTFGASTSRVYSDTNHYSKINNSNPGCSVAEYSKQSTSHGSNNFGNFNSPFELSLNRSANLQSSDTHSNSKNSTISQNNLMFSSNLSSGTSTEYVSNIIKSNLTYGVPKISVNISSVTPQTVNNSYPSIELRKQGAYQNQELPKITKNTVQELDAILTEVANEIELDTPKSETESKNVVAATLPQLGGQLAMNSKQLIQVPQESHSHQTKSQQEMFSLSGIKEGCKMKLKSKQKKTSNIGLTQNKITKYQSRTKKCGRTSEMQILKELIPKLNLQEHVENMPSKTGNSLEEGKSTSQMIKCTQECPSEIEQQPKQSLEAVTLLSEQQLTKLASDQEPKNKPPISEQEHTTPFREQRSPSPTKPQTERMSWQIKTRCPISASQKEQSSTQNLQLLETVTPIEVIPVSTSEVLPAKILKAPSQVLKRLESVVVISPSKSPEIIPQAIPNQQNQMLIKELDLEPNASMNLVKNQHYPLPSTFNNPPQINSGYISLSKDELNYLNKEQVNQEEMATTSTQVDSLKITIQTTMDCDKDKSHLIVQTDENQKTDIEVIEISDSSDSSSVVEVPVDENNFARFDKCMNFQWLMPDLEQYRNSRFQTCATFSENDENSEEAQLDSNNINNIMSVDDVNVNSELVCDNIFDGDLEKYKAICPELDNLDPQEHKLQVKLWVEKAFQWGNKAKNPSDITMLSIGENDTSNTNIRNDRDDEYIKKSSHSVQSSPSHVKNIDAADSLSVKSKKLQKIRYIPEISRLMGIRDVSKIKLGSMKMRDIPEVSLLMKMRDIPKVSSSIKMRDIPKLSRPMKMRDNPRVCRSMKIRDIPNTRRLMRIRDVPKESRPMKMKTADHLGLKKYKSNESSEDASDTDKENIISVKSDELHLTSQSLSEGNGTDEDPTIVNTCTLFQQCVNLSYNNSQKKLKKYSNTHKHKHLNVPCFKLDQEINLRVDEAIEREFSNSNEHTNVNELGNVRKFFGRGISSLNNQNVKRSSPLLDYNSISPRKKQPHYQNSGMIKKKMCSNLCNKPLFNTDIGETKPRPKSVLENVPGLNDFLEVRPRNTQQVVNVVQVSSTRPSTVSNQNIQTSTQVTPHIQRIGQPKLSEQKADSSLEESQSSSNSTPTSTQSQKPSTSQSPTLINILNSQVLAGPKSTMPSRQTPYINILSQQIIKQPSKSVCVLPSKSTSNNPQTATVIKVESEGNAEAIKPLSSNVKIVASSTQVNDTVPTTTSNQGGTILQFICKSSTLPKFQQAFGKTVYQTTNSDEGSTEASVTPVAENEQVTSPANVETKKLATKTVPVNVQPIAGNVIFRGQVPVGQTVSLIPPGSNTRQLFRITGSTHEQISLVKETVIQNKMSALLAAALQGKPKITEQNGELVEEYSATRITLCRPGTVPNTTRIVKPVQLQIPANVIKTPQTNMSSTTLEQLREFDMVYKQVKERSSNTAQPETTVATSQEPAQQRISFTYVNQVQKYTQLSPVVVVSSYNPIQQSGTSALNVSSQTNTSGCLTQSTTVTVPKVSVKSSKGKSIKSSTTKTTTTAVPTIPKPQQKPQEDEHTTQRIFDILAEYAEQLRNSPDLNNKPAPRRRSNPPTNPSSSSSSSSSTKKKKKKTSNCTSSLVEADNEDLTMGSEDSSGGNIVQLSMTDEEQSQSASITPPDTNLEPATTNTTARSLIVTDASNQHRNVIIADSSVGEALKMPNTTLIMPGSYIMPVSVVKGSQQIAVVSGGSKILTTVPARTGQNMLLFQSFVNQNKKAGISTVKYSTIQPFSGISSQNVAGVTAQPPVVLPTNSVATVTLGQPITLKKVEDNDQSNNTELLLTISQPTETIKVEKSDIPQPDSSTNLSNDGIEIKTEGDNQSDHTTSSDNVYNNIQKTSSVATSVIASVVKKEEGRSSEIVSTIESGNIKVEEQNKPVGRIESVLVNASTSNGPMLSHTNPRYRKPCEGVESTTQTAKEYNHNVGKVPVTGAKIFKNNAIYYAIRTKKPLSKKLDSDMQKQAAIERELRLQKSLSEECEDLGVDEPSTSDLFPEADLLFDSNHSPSYEQIGQKIQGADAKAKASMNLFSDDENSGPMRNDLFDYVEYHSVETDVDKINGNNVVNESASSCDDTTLLSNCGTMSEVTLNSPISPDYSDNTHTINKYKYKYTNRKKGEKNVKPQIETWSEVTSSEDTLEVGKEEETPIGIQEETVIDEALMEVETMTEDINVSEKEQFKCPLHGNPDRNSRRTSRKPCLCFNGSKSPSVSNIKKRINPVKSQTPIPNKKPLVTKKR